MPKLAMPVALAAVTAAALVAQTQQARTQEAARTIVGDTNTRAAKGVFAGNDEEATSQVVRSTPEEQGVSSSALADAIDIALQQKLPIHELLVMRHGVIVLDATFAPFPPGSRHDVASVTKSITSLLVGAAIQSGVLRDANVTLGEIFSGLDRQHSAIRIADLLAMQSGMDCGFAPGETELRAMMQSSDWVDYALHIPMRSEPGKEMGYCSPNYHLLSAVLTRVTGVRAAEFARTVLFQPLEIRDYNWPSDARGVTHGWGNLQLRAVDLAKIGQLLLNGGVWNGKRIVSAEWIRWSTSKHAHYRGNDDYGYGWWTHPNAPAGLFEAIGRGGQRLSILPAKNVVLVITGGGFEPGVLGEHLVKAVASDTALAPASGSLARLQASIGSARTRELDETSRFVPPCADSVSGRTYRVDANSLGLQAFTLKWRTDHAGAMVLKLADRTLELPARADGKFARAKRPIDGIIPIARALWKQPCELVFELDLLGKIDHYMLDIKFAGNSAEIAIHERTGLMRERRHAEAR